MLYPGKSLNVKSGWRCKVFLQENEIQMTQSLIKLHFRQTPDCIMNDCTHVRVVMEAHDSRCVVFLNWVIHVFYWVCDLLTPWSLLNLRVSTRKQALVSSSLNLSFFSCLFFFFFADEGFSSDDTRCLSSSGDRGQPSQSPTVKTIQSPPWSWEAVRWEEGLIRHTKPAGVQICLSGFIESGSPTHIRYTSPEQGHSSANRKSIVETCCGHIMDKLGSPDREDINKPLIFLLIIVLKDVETDPYLPLKGFG